MGCVPCSSKLQSYTLMTEAVLENIPEHVGPVCPLGMTYESVEFQNVALAQPETSTTGGVDVDGGVDDINSELYTSTVPDGHVKIGANVE